VQFRNSFEVQADPDRVYAFLLDVTQIIPCVPGAVLTEVIDEDTYRGKAKLKLGAIVMSYDGKATVTDRDPSQRSATLRAEGRETSGSGAAAMQARLGVAPSPAGSAVEIITDLTITGRAAQFGRGIIEDVSKRLIGQMADAIKARLETPPSAAGDDPANAVVASGARSAPSAPAEGVPLNVLGLLFSVLRERFARLFRRRSPGAPVNSSTEMEPES
jgi:uncharacterized protein